MVHSREASEMVGGPATGRVDYPIHGSGIAARKHFLIHREFSDRSLLPVKTLIRGIGLAMLGVCLLGLTGCGADNESDADKLQAKSGPVPKPEGPTQETGPPVKSMEDYAKQQQGKQSYAGTKYPGAAKAK
jgi:hypothetical protein